MHLHKIGALAKRTCEFLITRRRYRSIASSLFSSLAAFLPRASPICTLDSLLFPLARALRFVSSRSRVPRSPFAKCTFWLTKKRKKAQAGTRTRRGTVTVLELNEPKATKVASQSAAESEAAEAAPKANEMYFIDFKTCPW